MSWGQSTKQRRSALRRRHLEGALRLDQHSPIDPRFPYFHTDPWGRPCGLGTWAYWFERRGPHRFLAQTTLPGGLWVSTVWIGTSASFDSDNRPAAWESMVFGPKDPDEHGLRDLDCDRYFSRREALAGHRELVEKWRARAQLVLGVPGAKPPRAT